MSESASHVEGKKKPEMEDACSFYLGKGRIKLLDVRVSLSHPGNSQQGGQVCWQDHEHGDSALEGGSGAAILLSSQQHTLPGNLPSLAPAQASRGC